jgi:hypothetical protein
MENREQEILSEIKSMMASIRSQLEKLDAKMAELQQAVDPEGVEAEPIEINIDDLTDDLPVVEDVVSEEVPVDDDLPFGDVEPEAETEIEAEPEAVQQEDDDDLPGIFDVPETVTVAMKASAAAKPTINETLAADQAWRKDMPGTPVRDIRSAISLNDRVIFINLLFGEDAQAFVNTLSQINTMETLDQVVEYIVSTYPQWDLNSELVYRFMMAVRRKVK